MGRVWRWLRTHRTGAVRALGIVCAAAALFFACCWYLSFRAAEVFSRVAAERDLFPGTVTVEQIYADPLGRVEAKGVRWTGGDGTLLADVPQVKFRVKPWDVVTGRVGTMSVTDIAMDKAYVHLFFDERMRPLYVKPGREARRAEGRDPVRLTGPLGNHLFRCRVTLRDSTVEAETPDRHFRMEHVNLRLLADTERRMEVDLLAGPFSGTVSADRLALHGAVDFTDRRPSCDMALSIAGCRPSSLGAGVDIDDPVSADARVSGRIARPVIEGTLSIPVLDLPALHFTEVSGDFRYEDGTLAVTGVKGGVYGGTVEGSGRFDLDRKSYEADLKGHRLRGGAAAKDLGLRCEVELDLHMRGGGGAAQEAYGSFVSGAGKYHLLPFDRIAGTFDKSGGTIVFRDVVISIAMGDVRTDAFSIGDGRLRLGPVYLEDALSGRTERVY